MAGPFTAGGSTPRESALPPSVTGSVPIPAPPAPPLAGDPENPLPALTDVVGAGLGPEVVVVSLDVSVGLSREHAAHAVRTRIAARLGMRFIMPRHDATPMPVPLASPARWVDWSLVSMLEDEPQTTPDGGEVGGLEPR